MKFDVKVPVVGESISQVTIGNWHKKDGETVAVDDVLGEIESEKATIEIVAEHAGILTIIAPAGTTMAIGTIIAIIETEAGLPVKDSAGIELEKSADFDADAAAQVLAETDNKKVKATPIAKKLMDNAGLAPETVMATGPGGKITKTDVLATIKNLESVSEKPPEIKKSVAPETGTIATPVSKERPSTIAPANLLAHDGRRERREKMTTLRKTISRRLVAARNETAMLTTINEVEMSAIMAIRAKYKELFEKKFGIRPGFMSFFIKAVCMALKEYPIVNAMVDGDDIVYHEYCDIAVAIAAPQGLVVPVIRNAEKLSMAEIENAVAHLAEKARNKKLTIEEMTGGTFSITNGGVFGSLISTPIINAPQSAILGMHTIQERPIALDGQVVIRPMMYISLSYDHRIIDGRDSVLFLIRVKQFLEQPERMLLEI